MTQTVRSADGTEIAFERTGRGPAVILIGGAFNDKSTMRGTAAELADQFTTYIYDRRGRVDSGDTAPYAVEREVEDIAALIEHAGGSAALFGHSSGAILAIEAVLQGLPVSKLAVYEPPYIVDDTRPRPGDDLIDRLRDLIAADRRGDAAALFMTEGVGVPKQAVEMMRGAPHWPGLEAISHTLPYDIAICGPGNRLHADRLAKVAVPTLAVEGEDSEQWMRNGVSAVAATIPGAEFLSMPGEDHGVLAHPEVLAPVLAKFLA